MQPAMMVANLWMQPSMMFTGGKHVDATGDDVLDEPLEWF
jgi:hypothetical protein